MVDAEITLNNNIAGKYDVARMIKSDLTSNPKITKTLINIKNKLKQDNLVLTKADKGNTIVILPRNDYNNKISDILQNDIFQQLPADPTVTFQKEAKSTIENCKSIYQHSFLYSVMNPKPNMAYMAFQKYTNPISQASQ